MVLFFELGFWVICAGFGVLGFGPGYLGVVIRNFGGSDIFGNFALFRLGSI